MGSKERILRQKEDVRCRILAAGWHIVKTEGWQALTMRKIADAIEYTAPIIYGYFENKEALLNEFTRKGFMLLNERLMAAKARHRLPAKQLEAMWFDYWAFAFEEKEYYQLMFGVSVNCCEECCDSPESKQLDDLFMEAIKELAISSNNPGTDVCKKYYTFWSVVHGLISINLVNKGQSDKLNQEILKDAITGIIRTIVV